VIHRFSDGTFSVSFHVKGLGGGGVCCKEKEDDVSYQRVHEEPRDLFVEKIKEVNSKQLPEEGFYIPLQLTSAENRPPSSLKGEIFRFLQSNQKVFVLRGPSGYGKTSFCNFFTRHLLKSYPAYKTISFFVPFSSFRDPINRAVEETLALYGFTDTDIPELKRRKVLFIWDGIDEIRKEFNPYVTNRLNEWENSKLLITSCPSIFYEQNNFSPQERGRFCPALCREQNIAPFSEQQIGAYIREHIRLYHPTWSDANQYHHYLETIPGLQFLVETPFILRVIIEILPKIVQDHQTNSAENQLTLNRLAIYTAFIDQWFERQIQKLVLSQHLDVPRNFKEELEKYCQRLAQKMHQKGVYQISYSGDFLREDGEEEWEPFFSPATQVIRSAVPFQKVGENKYAFVHASVRDFFVSQDIFASAQNLNANSEDPSVKALHLQKQLNRTLLNKDHVRFLTEKLERNSQMLLPHLLVIFNSRENPGLNKAASNAITILNAYGFMFTGLDMRGICIPGANLNGAVFNDVDLSGADLSYVSLDGAFMRNVICNKCKMEGVYLGKRPPLECGEKVLSIGFSPDGSTLAVGGDGISLWDIQSNQCIRTIGTKKDTVSSLQFSPNGEIIISAQHLGMPTPCVPRGFELLDCDGEELAFLQKKYGSNPIRIWNVASQEMIGDLVPHCFSMQSLLSISPRGNILATTASQPFSEWEKRTPVKDNQIHFWDFSSMQHVKVLQTKDSISSLRFSSDGRFIAVALVKDPKVEIWDIDSWQHTTIPLGRSPAKNLCFYPLRNRFACTTNDGIIIYDLTTGKVERPLPFLKKAHPLDSCPLDISNDGKFIISSSGENNAIDVWSIEEERIVRTLLGHDKEVTTLKFSPTDDLFASGDAGGKVRFWDIRDSVKRGESFLRKSYRLSMVDDHPSVIAGITRENEIAIIDSHSKNLLKRIPIKDVQALRLSTSDKGYLACVVPAPSNDGIKVLVRNIWNAEDRYVLDFRDISQIASEAIDFSPSCRMLAIGFENNVLFLDIPSKRVVNALNFKAGVISVRFSSKENYLNITTALHPSDAMKLLETRETGSKTFEIFDLKEKDTLSFRGELSVFLPDGETFFYTCQHELDAQAQSRLFRDELAELSDRSDAKLSPLTRGESPPLKGGVLQFNFIHLPSGKKSHFRCEFQRKLSTKSKDKVFFPLHTIAFSPHGDYFVAHLNDSLIFYKVIKDGTDIGLQQLKKIYFPYVSTKMWFSGREQLMVKFPQASNRLLREEVILTWNLFDIHKTELLNPYVHTLSSPYPAFWNLKLDQVVDLSPLNRSIIAMYSHRSDSENEKTFLESKTDD
jgi:WD40 repeat protein